MKKRIAIYTGSLKQGGAERDISIFANELVKREYEVTIITVFSGDVFFPLDPRVRIIDVSKDVPSRSLTSLLKLKKIIQKLQTIHLFDFVICNMIGLNCLLVPSLRSFSCKVILRIASDPKSWSTRNKILSRWYYPKAGFVIAQTQYQLDCFGRKLAKKSAVIPNICEVPAGPAAEKTFSSKNIVYVGRMNAKVKRIDLLVKGFSLFARENQGYELSLYGEYFGRDSARIIERAIEESGVKDRVHVAGSTKNVGATLSKAFAYVFASPHEGMPNSVLESQLSGIPVVTSRFPGVEAIVTDRETGILYEFGDYRALAQALNELKTDFGFYKKISENGRLAKANYSASFVMGLWENVLKLR